MSKYCVLPGKPPVRLDSLDGHIIIIGEEPREIPEQFVLRAKAAGCLTEDELNGLRELLGKSEESTPASTAAPVVPTIPAAVVVLPAASVAAAGVTAAHPGQPTLDIASASGDVSVENLEKIKSATIELLNIGNAADFIASGAPKIEVLKDKLGFEVTAAERDAAYAAVKG